MILYMIIDSLYYGNIRPVDDAMSNDPEYRSLEGKIATLLKKLETELTPAQMSEVNQLHDYINDLYCYDCEEKFKLGLALGVKLIQEINDYLK